ncbi:MAG: DNA polymerase-3 subunit delta' [Planctomycetota bacterium]|jgi:DNA polymerase-3 subunit delta'
MTAAFDRILGHTNAKAFFAGVQETERIASGFLIHGDSGRGKLLLARSFIQRLFCDQKVGCFECPPCRRFAVGSHGDIEVVAKIEGKSRISIDQLRDLREWFHRAPYEADRRCAIIDGAHLMTEEAQNSLLKLLEEPPANGIILLVTENPQGLLETIHSRLQAVFCGPLSEDEITVFLKEKVDASDEDIAKAVALSNGSPGTAMTILSDETSSVTFEAAFRLFDLKTLPFGYAEMVSGGRATGAEARAKVTKILEAAMAMVSKQLAHTVSGDSSKPPLPSLAPWPVEVLNEAQLLLIDAADSLRSNTSPKSVLESLKIRMHRIVGQARRQKNVGGDR